MVTQSTNNYKYNKYFTVKTLSFYVIMLHVSATMATIRQNLHKNVQRKVNNDGERRPSLTSIITLVHILS
jgi:hypothetical protein